MDPVVVVIALGAAVAGFVQGLSGFGFGMVALSFWAWVVDPKLAAVMAVFGALTGQVIAALSLRRAFDWKLLLPFLAGGLLGIPLGIALLPHLDAQLFKTVLGTMLVLWCPAMLLSRHLPRIERGGRIADGVAGLLGGVMGDIGGFTGVIPTLWCTLRQMAKETQRSVIQNFNLATLATTMAAYVGTGIVERSMLPMFAIVAPAMLIPSLLGARVYVGISEATFRKVVLSALTASGIAMLASSVPALMAR